MWAATNPKVVRTMSSSSSRRNSVLAGTPATSRISFSRLLAYLLAALLPVLVAFVVYQGKQFDAADLPTESYTQSISVPKNHSWVLPSVDKLAEGLVPGPEDFAYDPATSTLYTGCLDGWIRRIRLDADGGAAAVEEWAYVGGRPLGVALSPGGHTLYVANAGRGLMSVTDESGGSSPPVVRVLTTEADGLPFGLPDGVDVAADGVVYFTDASWKHNISEFTEDMMGGRPYGRLLSYDPRNNSTRELIGGLYFANGIAVEPNGEFVIVTETVMKRCLRYYISGPKQGQTDVFIDRLPVFPDNIRYDGSGSFWIAFPLARTWVWDVIFQHRWLRNLAFVASKYIQLGSKNNAGMLEVGLDGRTLSLRSDPKLSGVTGGIRVGDYLYLGSLVKNSVDRIRITAFKNLVGFL